MNNQVRPVSLVVFLSLLLLQPNVGTCRVSCPQFRSHIFTCLGYIRELEELDDCCDQLRKLSRLLSSAGDKKFACKCSVEFASGLFLDRTPLSQLPATCGVDLGFPLTSSADCSKLDLIGRAKGMIELVTES